MRGLLVALATFLVIGCAASPPSGPTAEPIGRPIRAEARQADFRLVLQAADGHFAAGAPIGLATELSYLGSQPRLNLVGSGSGLVQVSLQQLDGNLRISAAATADCAPHTIAPGAPLAQLYAKSGSWSGDDPNAAFYKAFFADPLLRLPRGAWRIVAIAQFYVDECGGQSHELQATLDLQVE